MQSADDSGVTLESSVINDATTPVILKEEIHIIFCVKEWEFVSAHCLVVSVIYAHRLFIEKLGAIAAPGYVPTKSSTF